MTTPKDPRHPPLPDEEAALARVLRALPAGEPPAALDAAILKAASDALAAGGAARPRRRLPGWAIGTAAAAVLAIGIGMNLRPPTPGDEAKARAEAGLAEVAPTTPADAESKAAAGAAEAAAFDQASADAAGAAAFGQASADAAEAAERLPPGSEDASSAAGAGVLPSPAAPADATLELGRAAAAKQASPEEAAEGARTSTDRLLRYALPEPPAAPVEPPPAAHRVAPAPPPPPPPAPPAPPQPQAAPVAEAPATPSPAVAAPAPAPVEPAATADLDPQDGSPRLDAIEVTGARIKRSDMVDREAAAHAREQAARAREARASAAYSQRRQAAEAQRQRQDAAQALPAPPPAATAPAAPTVSLPPVAQDADLSAEAWLLRIRERRNAGDAAGARASLLAFARAFPDRRVPDDLADLLE